MMKSIFSAFLALFLSVPAVQAGEATERLEQFLNGLNTFRAEFKQSVKDQEGGVEESRGELLIARPGKFRLQYRKPYEQLYVADGKRLWLYDRDLAQVTVKKQDAALGSTPALLLSSTEPLTKNFTISEPGEREGLTWVELKPISEESTFETVDLGLADGMLKVMEMVDGLGQRTRIEFVRVVRNAKIDPANFRFSPPQGVDVIGEEE